MTLACAVGCSVVLALAAQHYLIDDASQQSQPLPSQTASAPSVQPPEAVESSRTVAEPQAYARDSFGPSWADIDGNGCRQRDDVLARDLTNVVLADNGCTVLSGVLHDPYTGKIVQFQHDRIATEGNPGSQGVQIDHIVSLSAAHFGGAADWTPERRLEFANDPANLIAVDGPTNASKKDAGPARWLPPNPDYVCTYAIRYTEILARWDLTPSEDDQQALTETLTGCELAK